MPAFEVVSPYEPAGESPKNILFFGGPQIGRAAGRERG